MSAVPINDLSGLEQELAFTRPRSHQLIGPGPLAAIL